MEFLTEFLGTLAVFAIPLLIFVVFAWITYRPIGAGDETTKKSYQSAGMACLASASMFAYISISKFLTKPVDWEHFSLSALATIITLFHAFRSLKLAKKATAELTEIREAD